MAPLAWVWAELTGMQAGDSEQAALRFLSWLRALYRPWLVVLDDLSAPADLMGFWPQDGERGSVVVTTRRRDAALYRPDRRIVPVTPFTDEEAVSYLLRQTDDDPAEAAALAGELGHLPLALAQASAYMRDRGLGCAAYRRRLASRRTLADVLPEADALPNDYRQTLATTWTLSIEAADQLRPPALASRVLALACLLDPNEQPARLFTTSAVLDYLRTDRDTPVESADAIDALHLLHRLSLADHDASAARLRVHALVQCAVRESLVPAVFERAALAAADAITELWPDNDRDRALGQVLKENTRILCAHANSVLWRAGDSLGQAGHVAAARDYWAAGLVTAFERLGSDHLDTLRLRTRSLSGPGSAATMPVPSSCSPPCYPIWRGCSGRSPRRP